MHVHVYVSPSWGVRDAGVISLELLTVCVLGPLCALLLCGIWRRRPWRHVLQVIVCVSELYGGWMTFCPEWVSGSPNLNTSDFLLFWVRLCNT